jgi:type VI secretion system protein ImpA
MPVDSLTTFDIDALLQPIAGDQPGGDPRAYSRGVRTALAELRNPPRSSNPDDPDAAQRERTIEWGAIIQTASQALRDQTKDLRVACHLTEAAMQRWGLAGLRDGFALLHRLCETYWESLAPELDPDEPDARGSVLENLLDDPSRGPQLPAEIRALPLLPRQQPTISLLAATQTTARSTPQDVSSILRQVSVSDAVELSQELDETLTALRGFQEQMLSRLGEYAPTFVHLQESLELLRHWFDQVFQGQLADHEETSGDPEPAAGDDAGEVSATPDASPTSLAGNPAVMVDQAQQLRAAAYEQLRLAAERLQRIEPHSPIPYMIQRAVDLGQLPFPELMGRLVSDESTRSMFTRELGLPGGRLAEPEADD